MEKHPSYKTNSGDSVFNYRHRTDSRRRITKNLPKHTQRQGEPSRTASSATSRTAPTRPWAEHAGVTCPTAGQRCAPASQEASCEARQQGPLSDLPQQVPVELKFAPAGRQRPPGANPFHDRGEVFLQPTRIARGCIAGQSAFAHIYLKRPPDDRGRQGRAPNCPGSTDIRPPEGPDRAIRRAGRCRKSEADEAGSPRHASTRPRISRTGRPARSPRQDWPQTRGERRGCIERAHRDAR